MDNFVQRIIIEPFDSFLEKLLRFFPNFLTALIILVIGIVITGVFRILFSRIFSTVKLDRLSDRMGISI